MSKENEIVKRDKLQGNLLPSTLNVSNLNELLDVLAVLAKSTNTGVATKEEAFSLFVRSRELGIGLGAALEHMHVINGKTGTDVHVLKALLSKAGTIVWEKTEDYVPLHEYVDGMGRVFTEPELKEMYPDKGYIIVASKEDKDRAIKEFPNMPRYALRRQNWRTTYKFVRYITLANGEKTTRTVISSFSWQEALQAGLPTKANGEINPTSNWAKYPKLMLDHRSFTFGSRDIGADYIMGLYSNSELFEMNGIDYNMNEDGTTVILDKDGQVIKTEIQRD